MVCIRLRYIGCINKSQGALTPKNERFYQSYGNKLRISKTSSVAIKLSLFSYKSINNAYVGIKVWKEMTKRNERKGDLKNILAFDSMHKKMSYSLKQCTIRTEAITPNEEKKAINI